MLDRAHITLNKNGIPNDPNPPMVTSGVRIGTPAIASRGFEEPQAKQTAEFILRVLNARMMTRCIRMSRRRSVTSAHTFPIYER